MDPVLCYTGERRRNFRHFSLANPVFKQIAQQVFNCGKCIFCRKKKAIELSVRCVLHASLYKQNSFITLTYDEKQPNYHNQLQYEDIQKFKKRLRRHCDYNYKKKIEIFNVHEYGKNGKKHWHLVIFNHDFSDDRKLSPSGYYNSENLLKLWPFGHHSIGDVTEASAMYQAQYTQKDIINGNTSNHKKSHSQHSAIGRDYFLQHYKQILELGYIPFGGRKIPIPRYFEKLAHRHYCHYEDQSAFHDLPHRKKLYSPLKKASREISELYKFYQSRKTELISELEKEWEETVQKHLTTKEKPDFIKSAENYLYDQHNKIRKEKF